MPAASEGTSEAPRRIACEPAPLSAEELARRETWAGGIAKQFEEWKRQLNKPLEQRDEYIPLNEWDITDPDSQVGNGKRI